jgi:hypothetical protein
MEMDDEPIEEALNEMESIPYLISPDLSERELVSIGQIIALWGALEYEVFRQTLMCFLGDGDDVDDDVELPKEMNNANFTSVLELWKTNVVNSSVGKRREVLEKQYTSIIHYKEFRNAIAHGMWNWSAKSIDTITSIRIRKREIINVHFTANDLESFVEELGKLNFNIKYPGGIEEYALELSEVGHAESRLWMALMTSNPISDELMPSWMREALKDNEK